MISVALLPSCLKEQPKLTYGEEITMHNFCSTQLYEFIYTYLLLEDVHTTRRAACPEKRKGRRASEVVVATFSKTAPERVWVTEGEEKTILTFETRLRIDFFQSCASR